MELGLARDVLAEGLWRLQENEKPWLRRQKYYDGEQCLPYAPEGVNEEYLELRKQAIANWLKLVADAPIQRVRAVGFRTGKGKRDKPANARWQANKMDSRQRAVYQDMMVHGRGLTGVWVNEKDPARPVIRPECGRYVHLEMDPADPFTPLWAVKKVTRRRPGVTPYGQTSGIVLPDGSPAPSSADTSVAWVHDDKTWFRFEAPGSTAGWGSYKLAAQGKNPLGRPPFVPYDLHVNSRGVARSGIAQLIPAQDALNTIRFNTLLAMQFSAYRQRVFTGYDPVLRDDEGQIVWQLDKDGVTPKLDSNGQKIPVVVSPGRFGVDRAIIFPGADTEVFDLAESNLHNYIEVLGEFLSELFALGQVPPQYLLNKMANLSGDALTAAESTLQALITDIETGAGEANEETMRVAGIAAGEEGNDFASETDWADSEARSFAQVVDGITKLATSGLPKKAWFPMIPGASPQQAETWLAWAEQEAKDAAANSPTLAAANAFRQHQDQLAGQQQDAGQPAAAGQ